MPLSGGIPVKINCGFVALPVQAVRHSLCSILGFITVTIEADDYYFI
jgi:hypothetical protein